MIFDVVTTVRHQCDSADVAGTFTKDINVSFGDMNERSLCVLQHQLVTHFIDTRHSNACALETKWR